MKRSIILLVAGILCHPVISQTVPEKVQRHLASGFDFYSDIWMNMPDSVDQGAINWGSNIYLLYAFPFSEKSPVSIAIGASLGIHKLYHDGMLEIDTNGVTQFLSFDSKYPDLDYNKNKLDVEYLDFPIELRYMARNGVRFSAGVKIGVTLQSKTKYRGDDYLYGVNEVLKVKFLDLANIENYRVAATARIGWKWIGIYGSYSLTKVFSSGEGPEIYPISVGISLFPY
ncbi:MAG TPA: outer membrane beta-barrel protein [Bacteroidales bacterium]|nr:outer membrane beta-barrel protein [Bacteroidales bacterium]